jgi:hypothetical protein
MCIPIMIACAALLLPAATSAQVLGCQAAGAVTGTTGGMTGSAMPQPTATLRRMPA